MSTETVPVQVVETGAQSHYRWFMLVMVIISQMLAWADRTNIGVVLPSLRREFMLTNLQAGSVVSSYFIAYTILQIPAGYVVSRYSLRGVVAGALCLFSGFTYLIGTSASAFQARVYRALLGATECPVAPASTAVIKNWFPPTERGIATGIWTGMMSIAITVSAPAAVWLLVHYGWRAVFIGFAVPGVPIAIIFYIFARRSPQESRYCNAAEAAYIAKAVASSANVTRSAGGETGFMRWLDKFIRLRKCEIIDTNLKAFTSWNVMVVAIAFIFNQAVNYGLLSWLPSYLLAVRGLTPMKMGWAAGAPWLGGCLGTIFGGTVSDRLLRGRRKPMIIFATWSTIVMLWLITRVGSNLSLLGLVLFGTGFSIYMALSSFFSYPMGLTTSKMLPLTVSIIMMAGNIGSLISPMVTGYLLDVFKNYNAVFMALQISAFCTFLCIMVVDEPA